MGTQLGAARAAPSPADLLWLDPQDVIDGGLERLRLPGAAALHPLGAIPYSYLPLQLRLRAAGYRVVDARLRLAHEPARCWRRHCPCGCAPIRRPAVSIVAHSMGGLIARGAMRLPGFERVRRFITLGVPHAVHLAPCRRFAAPIRWSGAWPRSIGTTTPSCWRRACSAPFPSIHQLLPARQLEPGADLFEIGHWPHSGPQPDPELLRDARAFVGDAAAQ